MCQVILEHRPHPEQGFCSCLGIVRLTKAFGPIRLEAACERALQFGARSYGSVKSILDNWLDGQPVRRPRSSPDGDDVPANSHRNIRGSRYYN